MKTMTESTTATAEPTTTTTESTTIEAETTTTEAEEMITEAETTAPESTTTTSEPTTTTMESTTTTSEPTPEAEPTTKLPITDKVVEMLTSTLKSVLDTKTEKIQDPSEFIDEETATQFFAIYEESQSETETTIQPDIEFETEVFEMMDESDFDMVPQPLVVDLFGARRGL